MNPVFNSRVDWPAHAVGGRGVVSQEPRRSLPCAARDTMMDVSTGDR
jgi:hypothetical protein